MTLPTDRDLLREAHATNDRLRAQLADATRHNAALTHRLAELTCGEPDPIMVAASATIAKLRAENARLTPTWREVEPPPNALVLRERPDGELQAVHTVRVADRICIMHSSGDVLAWGNARWCPIAQPPETP